jgi:hydroxypyruvate isomerase
MPRFAANLSMLFTEVPFLERFAKAARAGFTAVEFLFPYAFSRVQISQALQANGLRTVLFNLPPGDWEKGERGIAALPGREEEFAESLETALDYAKALGCPLVHAMAGIAPKGADYARMEQVYKANLAKAADFFAPHGISVGLEPITQRSMPGFFLRSTGQAAGYIRELRRPNLRLQFDFFHTQMEEGCVSLRFKELFPLVGHCQIAGVPERREPDGGELNYDYIFALVDEMGYRGFLGCEYNPAGDTLAGLGWFQARREAQRA